MLAHRKRALANLRLADCASASTYRARTADMSEVKPSNVRTRVLHEYDTLKTSIDELEASAAGLLSDGEPSVHDVLARCAKLFRELSDYIESRTAIRAAFGAQCGCLG